MRVGQRTRGQPLLALLLILVGWVGVRAATFDTPAFSKAKQPGITRLASDIDAGLPDADDQGAAASDRRVFPELRMPIGPRGPAASLPERARAPLARPAPRPTSDLRTRPLPPIAPPRPNMLYQTSARSMPSSSGNAGQNASAALEVQVQKPMDATLAAAHQLMWMAALSKMPMPADPAHADTRFASAEPFFLPGTTPANADRWSADGWLLFRRDSNARLAAGAAGATYGASQAGAIVRYRLSPASRHDPRVYARATTALNGIDEKELAAGFSARPFPALPVVAAAELRASDQAGRTRFRPAAMLITQIQPVTLPHGTRAEFYGQAGYVGGRFKTAFVDGQARIDKEAAKIGRATVRAGGGAWGGAQKGASRVDIGPSATVGIPISDDASARLALDWRFRVLGGARPKSGPAVTLSAGF